jgi:hypothetical protein
MITAILTVFSSVTAMWLNKVDIKGVIPV